MWEEGIILIHEPDSAVFRRYLLDILSVLQDPPAVRYEKAGNCIENDSLTGTRWTHDDVIIAFVYGEGDLIEQEITQRY
jgi:hypothetical protein